MPGWATGGPFLINFGEGGECALVWSVCAAGAKNDALLIVLQTFYKAI